MIPSDKILLLLCAILQVKCQETLESLAVAHQTMGSNTFMTMEIEFEKSYG